jgi:pyridoxal biosynthesis lyase PdxS
MLKVRYDFILYLRKYIKYDQGGVIMDVINPEQVRSVFFTWI